MYISILYVYPIQYFTGMGLFHDTNNGKSFFLGWWCDDIEYSCLFWSLFSFYSPVGTCFDIYRLR